MRAAHLLLDAEPRIFSDPLALGLSGFDSEAALTARLDSIVAMLTATAGSECAEVTFRYLRAGMTMRSRYAEDELARAVERGTAQYVILGAGLDSFAFRSKDRASRLRIFEIDHPVTQQWKRARLRASSLSEPSNLAFVPLDFERPGLLDGLRAAGYRVEEPAFLSWLGTTQYLTADAVFEALHEVASLAPGSEIVFTYQVPEDRLDERDRRVFDVLKERAAAGGAPWLTSFDPARLAARLEELGFGETLDFGPEQARLRYLAGRLDGLRAPPWSHIMRARAGSVGASGRRVSRYNRGVGTDGSVEQAWVTRWREAGPALAEQRARELREMTDAQALAAAEALLSLALVYPLAPSRLADSGLVRQQALFHRRLPP